MEKFVYLVLIILLVILGILFWKQLRTGIQKFVGGLQKFDWSNVKCNKLLGSGIRGDVYLVSLGNKKYALKKEKVLENQLNDQKDDFNDKNKKEIRFYQFISTLPKNEQRYFVKLHQYRISTIPHTHVIPEKFANIFNNNPKRTQFFKDLDESPYCAEYLMDLGGISFENIIENMMSIKKINYILNKQVAGQVVNIINILRNHNYLISDLHPGNLVINNNNVKLIDYSNMIKVSDENDKITKKEFSINSDLMKWIGILTNGQYLFLKYPPTNKITTDQYIKKIKSIPEGWDRVSRYIQVLGGDNITDAWMSFLVPVLFSILFHTEYISYYAKKTQHNIDYMPLLIPKEDLIFMLDHYHDMSSIVRYFD